MKTKNFLKRMVALIMSLTVCIALPETEVFAGDSEAIYYIDEESTETITINLDELLTESEEVNLNSRAGTSLPASGLIYINMGKLAAYQEVTIKVTWTPTTYSLYMGVRKSTSSSVSLKKKTGGSATLTARVSSSGTYYLALYNASTTKDLTITKCTYSKS